MPCQHIRTIRDMYRNPHNYIMPCGQGVYSSWPEQCNLLNPQSQRDFEHLVTVHRICGNDCNDPSRSNRAIYHQVKECNCEEIWKNAVGQRDATIQQLNNNITSLQDRCTTQQEKISRLEQLEKELKEKIKRLEGRDKILIEAQIQQS